MRSHAADLRAEVDDAELVDMLERDWQSAPLQRLSARAASLAAHAVKLTRHPASIDQQDIDRLRQAGCTDGAIHDLTQVAGFFAYYNRLSDGLGIDPEPDW